MTQLNKLLARQAQKYLGPMEELPQQWQAFLRVVSDAYEHYEEDRKLLERSSDLSSKEMLHLNGQLRREAEEVKKTHSELNRILDNIREAFFSLDISTGRYVFISPSCEEIYGYTADEFMADPQLWKSLIHPEDRAQARERAEIMKDGGIVDLEYRIIHKDNSIRWVNVKGIPTFQHGVLVRKDAVVNDITDKKKAQLELEAASRELNMLFNNIADVVYSVDMVSYQLKYMSPACQAIYGYSPDDFYDNGDLWNEVMHPDDRYMLEDQYARLHSGRQVKNQYRIIRRDGAIRWIENSVTPTMSGEGRVLRLDGVTRDVTERKQAEIDLRESEQQIQTIFRASLDAIVIIDHQGLVIRWDHKAEDLFGWTEQQMLGTLLSDSIIPERFREAHVRGMQYFMQTGAGPVLGRTLEVRALRSSGEEFDISLSISPSLVKDQYQFIGFIRDITERKEAEQKLAKVHKELNDLFNAIDEVIYSVDMISGQITHMSPACEKVYGYKPEDFYGDVTLWYQMTHPDDMDSIMALTPRLAAGEHVVGECRIVNKNKELRWIEYNMQPTLGSDGVPVRVDGIARDITEKKHAEDMLRQSEEGYRHICSNPMLGVTWATPDGILFKTNEAFANMLGYDLDELTGIHFSKFTHPEDNQRDLPLIRQLFAGEISNFRCEKRYITRSGSILWGELNLNSVRNQQGEVQYSIGVIQDISARKVAELELLASHESLERKVKERTAELEMSNKELEAFSYSVSHDLRSPLRIIHGYGQMLLDDSGHKLNEEDLENLQVIMSTSDQMGRLIDDLLNFSRLGRASFEKKNVDMTALAQGVIDEFKTGNADTAAVMLGDLPEAYCDAHLTRQVWINLISNAIKYSAKSEAPRIEIGSKEMNGALVYYVKDNGAGFDMRFADKLFGVFQRLHDGSDYEGTGVGLALTHRIVTRQGGAIWADARVGEGATFYFSFPHAGAN